MKYLFTFVFAFLLLACNEESDEIIRVPFVGSHIAADNEAFYAVLRSDTLRILDIGNSYTEDATAFLMQVCEASGADVSRCALYTTFRSGGSFKSWYDCYYDCDTLWYSISKVLGGIEVEAKLGESAPFDGRAFRQVLQQNKWDIVILHQASYYAPYYEKWHNGRGGYMEELQSLVVELQPKALIGFYVIHSYGDEYEANSESSSYARWQQIANSAEKLMSRGLCDFVIPYGTAIENLRQSSLNNDYDLTRDGSHLAYGLARYCAACCYYESIFAPRTGVSMMGQRFFWNGRGDGSPYPVVSVDDTTAPVAQRAAALAVDDWHVCRNPEVSAVGAQ